MSRTIQIPGPDELRERLDGLGRLLVARTWERSAIVWAYTGVQTGRRNGTPPPYPKLNIRQFARRGYSGLSTNKSVEHYRGAWEVGMARGWVPDVGPGDYVELPESKPFPSWAAGNSRQYQPVEDRVFAHVDRAVSALRRMSPELVDELTDDARLDLAQRVTALRDEAESVLRSLARDTVGLG